MVFYFPQYICFLDLVRQKPNLTAFTFKIQVCSGILKTKIDQNSGILKTKIDQRWDAGTL